MVFHKKSYTFDVLFNNKDEMLDLKQLTVEVCRIATEAGHFLKEERKNFRRERVMEKHAHDYVSYVVCRNECFYAWKGGKAFMNGEEIHVSDVRDIKNAFVFTELPYNYDQYKPTALHLIDNLYGAVGGIRMNGSAAAAICYIANGRFDAWAEAFIGKWDYSAAALIVLEAGGRVTNFYGDDHFIEGHHIIATNGYLHPLFLKLLAEVPPLDM